MKNLITKIDWEKTQNLVPAIIQDQNTDTVLMLGYMNRSALRKTITTKRVCFYSRTKRRLWVKGETSHHYLRLVSIALDCDQDTLLIRAVPEGCVCHKGSFSCFGKEKANPIRDLYARLKDRKNTMPENSYTTDLFRKGKDKICAKIDEESKEVVFASQKEGKRRLIEEAVDLLYHLTVLLINDRVELEEIETEIRKRQKS